MKKEVVFFGFILLLLPCVLAQTEKVESYSGYASLRMDFTLGSDLRTTQTDDQAKIDSIDADILFYPRVSESMKVHDFKQTSNAPVDVAIEDDGVHYSWKNPHLSLFPIAYAMYATVDVTNEIAPVVHTVDFPIRILPQDLLSYTKATEKIDLTPAIETQARSIIGAEDDLMKVSFLVADWVKTNIHYDLNTLTSNAVQSSSWVLTNKEGVCDELTNLFLSMLRSVGVPARFVSGMVYSNLDYTWGPHGWAEVYFPDIGWVPFDVTYGQYGWIDPSHLKLKDDVDSGKPSAEYSWKATGVDLKIDDLKITTQLNQVGTKLSPALSLSVEPSQETVGYGSYVPLLITVQNLRDAYLSTSLIVTKAPGIEGENTQQILLKPKETKIFSFLLKIPHAAEQGFIYTSQLEVKSSFDDLATSHLKYSQEYPLMSRDAAQTIIDSFKQHTDKETLTQVALSCKPDKPIYYTKDTAMVTCQITNHGVPSSFHACLQQDCKDITAQKDKSVPVVFSFSVQDKGRIPVIVESEHKILYNYIDLNVIRVPEIYITDITPIKVTYKDPVDLTFTLHSDTLITHLLVDFGFDHFNVDTFQGSREITVSTRGNTLMKGFQFQTSFDDEAGKHYDQKQAIPIEVIDIPFYATIKYWILDLFS